MLFVIQCLDRAGASALRPANRPLHLAYLENFQEEIRVGGPLLDDEGTPVGSTYIVDMADRAAVDAFIAAEPYAKAGMFQSVTILRWRKVIARTIPD